MPRSFVFSLSIASLVFLAVMIVSCGGSSTSGGGGGGGGPFNVVGTWLVGFTANVGASATGNGAINGAGVAAFFDASGNIVQMPTITGSSSFSGNLTAYAVNGNFFSGGVAVETDTAQGTVKSASSIAGTFTSATNTSGSFSIAPATPLRTGVVPPSGTMNGRILGFVDSLNFTFGSNGSFTGTDSTQSSACNLSGTLTQESPNNVFDVTLNLGPGGCISDTETGIAFESSSDYFNVNGGADANYLYVILLTSQLSNVRPAVVVIYQ